MSLPGEEASWQTIHSSLSSSDDKAAARVKLAEIEEIKARNAKGLAEYQVRQGRCPTCGRGPG